MSKTKAEKVSVDGALWKATQCVLTSEEEEALKLVPEELWTKHQTDIDKIKSAGKVQMQLRLGALLPRQRLFVRLQ